MLNLISNIKRKFFKRDKAGTLYLYKGDIFFISIWNQIAEMIRGHKQYNWVDFSLINISFETDYTVCEKELSLALFGFSMRIVIVYKEEECEKRFEKWKKEIEEANK